MSTELICELTGGVNAAYDTASTYPNGIPVENYDSVLVSLDLQPPNANVQFGYDLWGRLDTQGVHLLSGTIPAAVAHAGFAWGPGCSFAYNGMVAIAGPLLKRFNMNLAAAGAGVSVIVRVWGSRKRAGTKI